MIISSSRVTRAASCRILAFMLFHALSAAAGGAGVGFGFGVIAVLLVHRETSAAVVSQKVL
jgi:hypothetical protein